METKLFEAFQRRPIRNSLFGQTFDGAALTGELTSAMIVLSSFILLFYYIQSKTNVFLCVFVITLLVLPGKTILNLGLG